MPRDLLKWVDKMCKYDMDGVVEDTERTRFVLQMDGHTDGPRTDGQTDGQNEWNQYIPLNFVGGGINISGYLSTFESNDMIIAYHSTVYYFKNNLVQ